MLARMLVMLLSLFSVAAGHAFGAGPRTNYVSARATAEKRLQQEVLEVCLCW